MAAQDTTTPSRPVKPWDYQRLLWNGSGLSSGETLVAQYLAWKARSDADEDGWFSARQSDVSKATKIRKLDTVAERLQSLAAKGWLQCHRPVADGKYQATRYRLTQPVHTPKTGYGSTPQKRGTVHTPKMGSELPQKRGVEVRSYFTKDVDDGAPPSGGGGDGQESPNQAPPAPALAGARTGGAEPETPNPADGPNRNPVPNSEPGTQPLTEQQLQQQWDDERRDTQEAELAAPRRIRLTTADYLAPSCPTCSADTGQDCLGLQDGPKRQPAHRLRPTPVHASRLLEARLAAS